MTEGWRAVIDHFKRGAEKCTKLPAPLLAGKVSLFLEIFKTWQPPDMKSHFVVLAKYPEVRYYPAIYLGVVEAKEEPYQMALCASASKCSMQQKMLLATGLAALDSKTQIAAARLCHDLETRAILTQVAH